MLNNNNNLKLKHITASLNVFEHHVQKHWSFGQQMGIHTRDCVSVVTCIIAYC